MPPAIFRAGGYELLSRFLMVSLGCTAFTWSVFAGSNFWQKAAVEKVVTHIHAGYVFKVATLAAFKGDLDPLGPDKWQRPSSLHNAAVVELRFLERALSDAGQNNVDALLNSTNGFVRQSLASVPADPLLWLVLFWVENNLNGFKREHLEYLKMSYFSGPNEGWVAVKRSRFAIALFSALSPELTENATREFARLVDSEYFSEAADILGGPGWSARDKLMAGLKDLDEVRLKAFDRTIFRRAYDVSVPGIRRPDWRPWH